MSNPYHSQRAEYERQFSDRLCEVADARTIELHFHRFLVSRLDGGKHSHRLLLPYDSPLWSVPLIGFQDG